MPDDTRRIEPGSPEWHRRVREISAEEETQPLRWWYLSFANDSAPNRHGGFIAAVMVSARGFMHAVDRARQLERDPSANPHRIELDGEVRGNDFRPEFTPPARVQNRVLSWEDLNDDPDFGPMERWK